MASITLRGISKSFFGTAPILNDVDLDIAGTDFCVFLGPSGCGKSTLLRIIAGLEDPTTGELLIDGRRVNEVVPAERGVAMVFQSYALFPHMTVAQNMGFGLKLAKKPASEIQAKVLEAARILQLEALLERKPKALSGGQRQRVAIGRAIVREPGVFLFDEPLSNLDASLRGQTRVEIARLHSRFEKTSTVYVTHDQIEAMTLADKIVLLRAGRDIDTLGSIAQVGAPLELYHRPRNRFVAGFIGSPQMSFLEAQVAETGPRGVAVKLNGSGEIVQTRIAGQGVRPGQPVSLGIRPEHLEEMARNAAPPEGVSVLERRISLVERLGEQTYLHLEDSAATSLIAKLKGNSASDVGDSIRVGAEAGCFHLFDANGDALLHLQ